MSDDVEFKKLFFRVKLKTELQKLAFIYGNGELKEAVRKWIAQVKAEEMLLRKVKG